MDHLYGQAAAQVVNYYYRTSDPPSPGTSSYPDLASPKNGILLDRKRSRLVQSAISTRILEVLLSIIALSTTVAWFLTRDVGQVILPMNPTTIAAKAAMLVGSELLEVIPEGLMRDSDEEVEGKDIFGDYAFGLGWWIGEDGERRYVIDFGVPDDIGP